MGEVSTKVIATGIVGALGVVATTQVPVVQATVRDAVNVSPDSAHVTHLDSIATFVKEVTNGQKSNQITTKSDVIREKGTKKSALLTVKTVKTQVKKANIDLNVVASQAMANALVSSSSQQKQTNSYYDDSETDASTTPAEDAVVSEANSASSQSDATSVYTIQDGDTLAKVAAANGVSIADLQAANPDADTNMLQIGQSLYVPNGEATYNNSTTSVSGAAQDGTTTASATNNTVATQTTDDATQFVQQSVENTATLAKSAVFHAQSPVTKQQLATTASATNDATRATTMTNGDVVLSALPSSDVMQNRASTVTNNTANSTETTNLQKSQTTVLTQTQRNAIVTAATRYASQNIPYVWGGKSLSGLDCSGLVAQAYHAAGVTIPAYTIAEEAYMTTHDVQSNADIVATAQPGDLLFWGGHGATWQVAVYIGNGQYVIASEPGQQVQIANLDNTTVLPNFIGSYSMSF